MLASQIESPFADGHALLQTETSTKTFRKEEYQITYYHYICQVTGESFSTDESDEANVDQVYSQYRAKHKILSPEQIRQMRRQYAVTAARMSLILGLGANQYRQYEDGEVPSLSNAKLLNLATNPKNFRELVEEKRDSLRQSEYNNLMKLLRELIDQKTSPIRIGGLVVDSIVPTIANEYTGFSTPDAEKFQEMVLYFFEHLNYLYLVRLFKLLFYAEFCHYKHQGLPIAGYPFKAIQRGPVPENYEIHIGFMVQQGLLDYGTDAKHTRSDDGGSVTTYYPKRKANMEVFSKTEREILDLVRRELGFKKRPEIEDLSHKEDGWIDNEQQRTLISYSEYAPKLKAL